MVHSPLLLTLTHLLLRRYTIRARHIAPPLCASQAGDDRGESIHVPLKDPVIATPPAPRAHRESHNDLAPGANDHRGVLEDVGGAHRCPPPRQFLRRNVTMVRYLNPLH